MGEIGGWAAVVGAAVTAVIGWLVAVIGYLLTDQRGDRRIYEAAIEKAEARADAAEVVRLIGEKLTAAGGTPGPTPA